MIGFSINVSKNRVHWANVALDRYIQPFCPSSGQLVLNLITLNKTRSFQDILSFTDTRNMTFLMVILKYRKNNPISKIISNGKVSVVQVIW